MNMSRAYRKRWVIDNMGDTAVRYAKALAAEHDVRVADVVEAAILDLWDKVNGQAQEGSYWKAIAGE